MPVPTPAQIKRFRDKRGPYRLGCQSCDRGDFDGVKRLPRNWDDVRRIQSLKESLTTYEGERPPPGFSVMDWETHMGICPDCREDETPA